MKIKPSIILLIIVVAGAAYYFLVEQPRHRREQTQVIADAVLTTLAVDSVVTIVIERDGERIRFERDDDEWRMTSPVTDRALRSNVNVLLLTFVKAKVTRRLDNDDEHLVQYGLLPPQAVVYFGTAADDEALIVRVGDWNLTKSGAYAQLGDDTVVLVPAGLPRYTSRPLFDYRDTRVADFVLTQVASFEMEGEHTQRWTQRAWNDWYAVVDGDTIAGDTIEIEAILRQLRAMRARAIAEPGATLPAVTGSIHVMLGDDSLETYTFTVADTGNTYVTSNVSTRTAVVAADVLSVFHREMQDLRDRRVVRPGIDRVRRVILDTGATPQTIVRRGDNWEFPNPEMGAINQAAVTEFMSRLQELKFREITAEQLTTPELYSLNKPIFTLTLLNDDGEVFDVIMTGPDLDARRTRYATSASSGHLGILDAEPIIEMERRFAGFRIQ